MFWLASTTWSDANIALPRDRFSALAVLSLIAFAYVGGITMVSGAAIAGVLAVQGLSQYAFQKWFGIAGTWTVLMASIAVIGNVILAPAGTSGMFYLKRRARLRSRAEALIVTSAANGKSMPAVAEAGAAGPGVKS